MPNEVDNWNTKNLTTFSTWIQVASFKIECLDSAIHKNRSIIQQSVIAGLILSTVSGSISITQFGNFSEPVKFVFNLLYTFLTFNIAFITGYVKTFQIQEKLEEYLQLKQNWISFSASITAELQLPKELRRDAEVIISENKEKYLDLFKNDLEVSTSDVKRAIHKLDISKKDKNYLPIDVKNSRSLSISNIMLNTVLTHLINEINETYEKNAVLKEEEFLHQQKELLEIVNNEKCFTDIIKLHKIHKQIREDIPENIVKLRSTQPREETKKTYENNYDNDNNDKDDNDKDNNDKDNIEIKIHDIHAENGIDDVPVGINLKDICEK
jgi:hypothetical protein